MSCCSCNLSFFPGDAIHTLDPFVGTCGHSICTYCYTPELRNCPNCKEADAFKEAAKNFIVEDLLEIISRDGIQNYEDLLAANLREAEAELADLEQQINEYHQRNRRPFLPPQTPRSASIHPSPSASRSAFFGGQTINWRPFSRPPHRAREIVEEEEEGLYWYRNC